MSITLEDKIRTVAKKIGIDVVGFSTGYSNDRELIEILTKRKEKNMETEFEEKSILKRVKIDDILEDYKTIIVIGVSYNFLNYYRETNNKLKGKVSKSSLGRDYHLVLKEKAEKLISEIDEIKNSESYFGIDTSPLLEREIVYSSGLGYFSKNTNIINEKLGSFVFYGYILSNKKIDYKVSEKEIKDCGGCNICRDACPTNALENEYNLNYKKCISYLTQTKNKIPYDLREKMGFNIYGCDICQNTCPLNKLSRKKDFMESDFFQENYIYKKDLISIINMNNKEFKETYKKTSSGWRGKNIIRRNAIIAIGNTKNKKYIYEIDKFLEDESDIIKEYIIWSILKLDFEIGVEILKKYNFKIEMEQEIRNVKAYFKGKELN